MLCACTQSQVIQRESGLAGSIRWRQRFKESAANVSCVIWPDSCCRQVCFHGPVKEAGPFFRSLGFICPVRKDVANFLQEVTTPKGIASTAYPHVPDQVRAGWQLVALGLLQYIKHILRTSGSLRMSVTVNGDHYMMLLQSCMHKIGHHFLAGPCSWMARAHGWDIS